MTLIYCADPALQSAITDALAFHDLWPAPAAVTRRPRCADSFEAQLARIARFSAVINTVRAEVTVDEDTRGLIGRLVDSASVAIESGGPLERAAVPPQPEGFENVPLTVSLPQRIQSRRAPRKAVRR